MYSELDSTNTRLRELAIAGAPDTTVVVARAQTAGRGRLGRSWHSPAGAGLYASVLLRTDLDASRAYLLTLAAAISVAESLAGLGVGGVAIKWPNDVLIRERKVSGILLESGLADGALEWAIVGIGVNVRNAAVPDELRDRATSLEDEGIDVEPPQVLTRVLERLAVWRPGDDGCDDAEIVARWLALAPMVTGTSVRVNDGTTPFEAMTDGLTEDGRLRVRRDDGRVELLSAADVTLNRS